MELRNRRLDPAPNLDGNTEINGEDDDEPLLNEDDDHDLNSRNSKSAAGDIPLDVRVENPTGRFGGDGKDIAVLLFLYVLQGIPLGLAAAVPLILTNKHVSYR